MVPLLIGDITVGPSTGQGQVVRRPAADVTFAHMVLKNQVSRVYHLPLCLSPFHSLHPPPTLQSRMKCTHVKRLRVRKGVLACSPEALGDLALVNSSGLEWITGPTTDGELSRPRDLAQSFDGGTHLVFGTDFGTGLIWCGRRQQIRRKTRQRLTLVVNNRRRCSTWRDVDSGLYIRT